MPKPGGILYAIRAVGTPYTKIGSTRGTVASRLRVLQTAQPFPLEVVATMAVEANVQQIETVVHTLLAEEHARGEWFTSQLDAARFVDLVQRAFHMLLAPAYPERASRMPTPCHLMVGKAVRRARLEKGFSQHDVETRTGIAQKSLSRIENGLEDPLWPTMVKLALWLNLDLNALALEWAALHREEKGYA